MPHVFLITTLDLVSAHQDGWRLEGPGWNDSSYPRGTCQWQRFMRVNSTVEEDFHPMSVSHFLTPRASHMANSKVKGWESKLNISKLMGETEQPYGKSDECMKGNVICHKGDQQAYQMKSRP